MMDPNCLRENRTFVIMMVVTFFRRILGKIKMYVNIHIHAHGTKCTQVQQQLEKVRPF